MLAPGSHRIGMGYIGEKAAETTVQVVAGGHLAVFCAMEGAATCSATKSTAPCPR